MKRSSLKRRNASQADLEIQIDRELKERYNSKTRQFVTSFKPPKSRRRRSASMRGRNKTTRSKKNKSADDIDNLVADDLTRDLRAERRLRIAKREGRKANIFDRIQKMPRDLQTTLYLMEHDSKTQHLTRPVNSTEVKQYSNDIRLVPLKRLMKTKQLNDMVYKGAWDVFRNEASYHTFMFDTSEEDNRESIYHNNKVFATNYDEFVDKTRIEYSVDEDFIRYRVIPTYMKKLGSKFPLNYDGFIVVDTTGNDVVIDPLDWYTDLSEERPDTNPVFTDRIRTIMKTYFSNIENRRSEFDKMTNKWTGLIVICVLLHTSHYYQEDFSHHYRNLPHNNPENLPRLEEDHIEPNESCCVVTGGNHLSP